MLTSSALARKHDLNCGIVPKASPRVAQTEMEQEGCEQDNENRKPVPGIGLWDDNGGFELDFLSTSQQQTSPSRFEATRGLFWGEPRNFESLSDGKSKT
ncbi:hypothetical protein AVEN_220508-1 [Araneus ventricosus]|uniref:Uncharacterized protein n=1 Tax=Araneus ventricosus TaxID=182803 RepID=A0A4Y2GDH0_ARAVE|nr:hypothetical protein AVEN_220508-1 [Araneus ventricosus]